MTILCKFSVLAGILTLAATASAFGGDDPALATLPYKQLWMLGNPDGLPKEFKSEISFRVTAAGKQLPPADLKIHIQSRDQKIPLQVSEKGEFRLPQKRAWADANAKIVTNQPKGSMAMTFGLSISGSKRFLSGKSEYRVFMAAVHAVKEISTPIAALTGQILDDRLFSARFQLKDKASEAREIIIHSDDGNVKYRANDDGLIVVPYDRLLFEQNPKVEVPEGRYDFKFKAGSEQGGAPNPLPAE